MRDLLAKSLADALEPLTARGVDMATISSAATRSERKRTVTDVVESRRRKIEARAEGADAVVIEGYAATWDTWYDVAGGPPYGWSESIARGAVDKSIAEGDDVRMLANHDGLAMARTSDGSLELRADEIGIWFRATMDSRRVDVRDMVLAIEAGNVDQCSWAFVAIRQEWNEDYTKRTITEAKMYDVSVVTYPANPATIVGVRSDSVAERRAERRDADPVRFTPRQIAQYEADDALVSVHGKYDQGSGPDGAHYVDASPFPGLVCASCAFYDGARSCEIVSGDIAPEGVCKRWIIPADLIQQNDGRKGYPLTLAIAQVAALG